MQDPMNKATRGRKRAQSIRFGWYIVYAAPIIGAGVLLYALAVAMPLGGAIATAALIAVLFAALGWYLMHVLDDDRRFQRRFLAGLVVLAVLLSILNYVL